MRVLITGAAGFIGSHLADRLIEDGHDVAGIDNLTTGRADNYPGQFALLDIADRHALYAEANRVQPELIVHCAASYSDPNLWHRDVDTNTTGTVNVTLAAHCHDARLVYFQTALPPISSYAISKIAGEQYIALSGVPHVIFRLANVYGPRNLSGPIPTFYKRLTAGKPCTVVNTRRDMVYIDDLVRAVTLAVADNGIAGRLDLCSGHDYAIGELYSHVADAVGSSAEPEPREPASGDVPNMVLDPGPAAEFLGWAPETRLRDGIQEAVDWYSAHGVSDTYTHLALKT